VRVRECSALLIPRARSEYRQRVRRDSQGTGQSNFIRVAAEEVGEWM